MSDIQNVELVFGIDKDDPTRDIVYKIAAAIPFVRIVDIENNGKFIGINRIWNILAANTENEIFGYIGDDMIFKTPDWDIQILEELIKMKENYLFYKNLVILGMKTSYINLQDFILLF